MELGMIVAGLLVMVMAAFKWIFWMMTAMTMKGTDKTEVRGMFNDGSNTIITGIKKTFEEEK